VHKKTSQLLGHYFSAGRELATSRLLGGGGLGSKIWIAKKSVPKKLVIRYFLAQFFWLSKFYFRARPQGAGKWRVPGRLGSSVPIAGKFFYALAAVIVLLLIHGTLTPSTTCLHGQTFQRPYWPHLTLGRPGRGCPGDP